MRTGYRSRQTGRCRIQASCHQIRQARPRITSPAGWHRHNTIVRAQSAGWIIAGDSAGLACGQSAKQADGHHVGQFPRKPGLSVQFRAKNGIPDFVLVVEHAGSAIQCIKAVLGVGQTRRIVQKFLCTGQAVPAKHRRHRISAQHLATDRAAAGINLRGGPICGTI